MIGKRARYLAKDKAMDAVAGYCLGNDVSERAFQMEHGQTIAKGKGAETFGPLGPWFVSKDEIKDPQNLAIWSNVNGEKRQHGNTRNHDFRLPAHRLVLLAILRAGAGRRDRHRHAAGRRPRPQAGAEISDRPATWSSSASTGWARRRRRSCRSRRELTARNDGSDRCLIASR